MGAAFHRIYFDLETELYLQMKEALKASGQSQREYIRDAIEDRIKSQQVQRGKVQKGKR